VNWNNGSSTVVMAESVMAAFDPDDRKTGSSQSGY
jgi:hypothetical protein